MRQSVAISISDGTKENEEHHEGILIENETGMHLFYGKEDPKDRLEITGKTVKILRQNGLTKKMEIVLFEYMPFEIHSPYGILTLETHGKALEILKEGADREIHLSYDITSEKEVQDTRELVIRISPVDK